jgi:hypothetical protein
MDDVDAQLGRCPTVPSRRRKLLFGLMLPPETVRPVWQLRAETSGSSTTSTISDRK